ncbi:MAG: hypothetical protein ABW080_08815 [Candidatus Thiodiazotropha sp.]
MNRSSRISIFVGDAFTVDCDVLVLKYAQKLHGLDGAVERKLRQRGITFNLPSLNQERLIDTGGALQAKSVQFVGVKPIRQFRYSEIRDFARRSLVSLAKTAPDARHLAFTIHGPGYGLDEIESFESEIAGIVEAVSAGSYPRMIEAITFVEADLRRAERISKSLKRLFPTNSLPLDGLGTTTKLTTESQDILRTAGYSSSGKPHVFVAMPFAADMDDIYHYGIQGAVNASGLLCERADLSAFTGDVMEWVKTRITSAKLVIADLSSSNPNVYLEVGYAWGCRVPTVLLIRETDELKFDVKGQRCVVYRSIKHLEESLKLELKGILENVHNSHV